VNILNSVSSHSVVYFGMRGRDRERERERDRESTLVREREREGQGERQTLCSGETPERGRARFLERQRGSFRYREPARDRSYDNSSICRRSRERGRDRERRNEKFFPRCRSISRKMRHDETYGSLKGGNQEHNRQDEEPDQEVWTKVISRREAKAAKKNFTQNRAIHNLSANHPNWRDKEDITSFYFTNFTDDVNEVRLWGKFKIWEMCVKFSLPNGVTRRAEGSAS